MDLQSLGHAAATYQKDPRLIAIALKVVQAERAAAAGEKIHVEAQPALTLNGVKYFLADEIVEAIGWLAENDANAIRAKQRELAVNG